MSRRLTSAGGGRRGWAGLTLRLLVWLGVAPWLAGAGFQTNYSAPTLDRWVYPFGDFDGQRPVAPTWASFDVRFDTRDGQFLLAWDTAGEVPTNAPAGRYLVTRVRVTIEHTPVPSQPSFVYDATFDSYRTYLTNSLALPDTDPGRPVELYGAGYRGGFTALTFAESSPFGLIHPINNPTNVSIGTRNVYAADFEDNGQLRDVSNNVGQASEPFEVAPFAIGQTSAVAPGQDVPDGTQFSFDLALTNPLVLGYVQQALRQGRLPVVVADLHRARAAAGGIGVGGGVYPNWVTKENLLGAPATLEIEGTLISDTDTDNDGLPDDWERAVWRNLAENGSDDFDRDGMTNAAEFQAGTDPQDPASRLYVVAVRSGADGPAELEFPFAASRTYHIETAVALGIWLRSEGTFRYASNGMATWVGTTPAAEARFFRVVVE